MKKDISILFSGYVGSLKKLRKKGNKLRSCRMSKALDHSDDSDSESHEQSVKEAKCSGRGCWWYDSMCKERRENERGDQRQESEVSEGS